MKVNFNITGITIDRRTKAQLESARALTQDRLDQAVELEWRRRVQANISRRLDRKVARFLQENPSA
jgi:hypothetical protein